MVCCWVMMVLVSSRLSGWATPNVLLRLGMYAILILDCLIKLVLLAVLLRLVVVRVVRSRACWNFRGARMVCRSE